MAKKSAIEKNEHRRQLAKRYAAKRARLKAIANDETGTAEERFEARLKLAEMPRNSAPSRIRNRCQLTGRSRGYLRKFNICRNQLREMALKGMIPGLKKASW